MSDVEAELDIELLERLRAQHPAWRLLRSDNAALTISFLAAVFVTDNVRQIPLTALESRLDDALFAANAGEVRYPKSARAYLEDWSSPESGWLRKFYADDGSDEAHFDATPAVEKVVTFAAGLRGRSFVGTESRLNTAIELLRQVVYGTEEDPKLRLAELHRQRAELDAEIARVQSGRFEVLDEAGQLDRFQQFSQIARELLADFREVEANFRELDRELRQRIALWSGSKGELLEEFLSERGSIADSVQGRTFQAFYDFLLSGQRQQELNDLLDQVLTLSSLAGADRRLRHVHYDWLAAGQRTQATVRSLSEQLRRFLDEQVWLENRRIIEILRSIEGVAVRERERSGELPGAEIDAMSPDVVLPMERRLYRPVQRVPIDSTGISDADPDVDTERLLEQVHVDTAALVSEVRRALIGRSQVSLASVIAQRPVEQGLGELVAYLSLDDGAFSVVFDEDVTEQIGWADSDGRRRTATLPRVSFARATARVHSDG